MGAISLGRRAFPAFSRREGKPLKLAIEKEIDVLDNIPFEERRVIDELVELWQTCYEPRDLLTHIAGTWKPGGGRVTWFFAQVHQDLRTDKRSKYAAFSASEFKRFL